MVTQSDYVIMTSYIVVTYIYSDHKDRIVTIPYFNIKWLYIMRYNIVTTWYI